MNLTEKLETKKMTIYVELFLIYSNLVAYILHVQYKQFGFHSFYYIWLGFRVL